MTGRDKLKGWRGIGRDLGLNPLPSGLGTDNVEMKLLFVSSLKARVLKITGARWRLSGRQEDPVKFQTLVLWSLNPEDFDVKMALLLWSKPEAQECTEAGFGQSDRERRETEHQAPSP